MKILFLYKEEWERDYINNGLVGDSLDLIYAKDLDEVSQERLNEVNILSLFVSHQCKKAELDKIPNLKLIATRSTGYDHIDINEARQRNIEIVYVPAYGDNTVAEFAFALLLAIARKVPEAHKQITETGSFSQTDFRGFDLRGKTIGVIGTGKIGTNAIKIAKGFGMNVVAYDPFPKNTLSEELNFKYVGFEELLQISDVITLHALLNDSTRHMINEDSIRHIKKGAVLINTARGGLVQTSALIKALEENILSGAGLDVLEEENYQADELKLLRQPNPEFETLMTTLSNHYLIDHPRVIITPHIAFDTNEAVKRILDTTIESITAFLRGEVINRVP